MIEIWTREIIVQRSLAGVDGGFEQGRRFLPVVSFVFSLVELNLDGRRRVSLSRKTVYKCDTIRG